jgi:hypothetical protein
MVAMIYPLFKMIHYNLTGLYVNYSGFFERARNHVYSLEINQVAPAIRATKRPKTRVAPPSPEEDLLFRLVDRVFGLDLYVGVLFSVKRVVRYCPPPKLVLRTAVLVVLPVEDVL